MSEKTKGSLERINQLVRHHYAALSDDPEFQADLALLESITAQVAALTAQRDAAVAACKAADDWLNGEQRVHPDVDGIASLRAQLAAAIAMTEGTKE